MKLIRYADGAGPRCGILDGGDVIDVPYPSWPVAFASWEVVRADLDRAIVARSDTRPLDAVRLLPPLRPAALHCATGNYFDKLLEDGDRPMEAARVPFFFTKVASTVIGPGEAIRIPRKSGRIDWGASLGVVIGRPCFQTTVANALSFVAGYTIVNDIAAPELERGAPDRGTDWLRGRSFDTSAPLGPSLTLAADVKDPHALIMRTWVNDTLHQDSTSAQMIVSIPEQIAYLSEQLTLHAGDVIATGTPAGTGHPRGIYLRQGDVVTIEIEGLGVLRNPVL